MSHKWLPHFSQWSNSLAEWDEKLVKKAGGVTQALKDFWYLDTDEYDKRLAQLSKLLKLATDLKTAKELIAEGPEAVKAVGELVAVIPTVRKKVEEEKKQFLSEAARPIDLQFIVMNWDSENFEAGQAFAEFESPGMPKVNKNGPVTSNGFKIKGVRLRPIGAVNLRIKTAGGQHIVGTTDYELKPGKTMIQFKAVQHYRPRKTTARRLFEASKKLGLKGKIGVDWEVVKAGVESTKEAEWKDGFDDAVEWEIKEGLPTFATFAQIR